MLAWNALVASFVALAANLLLMGRAWPAHATRGWLLCFGLLFLITMLWLTAYSSHLRRRLSIAIAVEMPLLALTLSGSLAIYLSDYFNHQARHFLQPTPAIAMLLAVLLTFVLQAATLRADHACWSRRLADTLVDARRWAVPTSLILLGFLQGASYLWVIGNDFTRYWTAADAMASGAGYPASYNLPIYVAEGMDRYSIELPVFPLSLLLAFALAGHDTVGAHLPALVANTLLPLLLYAFYHRAGFKRPLAYAAAAIIAVFPFLRLYTLNAPVPDAVFITLLVTAGYLLLHLIGTEKAGRGDEGSPAPIVAVEERAALSPALLAGERARGRGAEPGTHHWLCWTAFGVVAGLAAMTRAEGMLYAVIMFVALLPYALRVQPYLAGIAFLLTIAPFSLTMMRTFGRLWPNNAGSSFGLHYVRENLDWMGWSSLPWYAGPFGMSPSNFGTLLVILTAVVLLGVVWMLFSDWQLALLPVAAAIQVFTVFAISPWVAGAEQWFDFFRHMSYGIPFAMLPILFLVRQVCDSRPLAGRSLTLPFGGMGFRLVPAHAAALLGLAFVAYLLHLLATPSRTWGQGASQLLTSDVWVTLPEILDHRYPLPLLPFAHIEGVLMIDPSFAYIHDHIDAVKEFFDHCSTLNTGRGRQYELSSLLVVLFGAVFAFTDGLQTRVSARRGGETGSR